MQTCKIPNLTVDNIGTRKKPLKLLKGYVELPCWTGYFLVEKPNYLFKTPMVTNGRITLWVDGKINADDSFDIGKDQEEAYAFLVEQQERIKDSILQELRNEFPNLLATEYASWDHEEGGFPRADEMTPAFDFKNYIGPGSISIEEETKDGVAYLRWHFQCLWDPEHGFEVITHKDRVIDLSPDADIFKMNKDNGTYEEEELALQNKQWKLPKKKSWWQFW